ncbi:MAG: HAMP domain-containing histidine kinase [Phycisphaerae bacterium]|nr:HAMP domain-containing histidine kinase [Phycisphaerae bacterium]
MPTDPDPTEESPARPIPRLLARPRRHDARASGFLAGLRIRKKLLFLHTVFSLTLAAILLLAVRPALNEIVYRAELDESQILLQVVARAARQAPGMTPGELSEIVAATGRAVRFGTAEELGLGSDAAARAMVASPAPVEVSSGGEVPAAVSYIPRSGHGSHGLFVVAEGRSEQARRAVLRLYMLVTAALLTVYALVAVALEVFILPRHVYAPIRRILAADQAVREGRSNEELVDPGFMPADELGEIMRSRNEAILSLREHQRRLAEALDDLNASATDLKRKNHLLENARKNLADADRLASLGMMSAGIAHELNTPLAVLKGLIERLAAEPARGVDPATAALMVRVVGRLERLGESLLDFARARPPASEPVELRAIAEEAATLVSLDRRGAWARIENRIDPSIVVECDAPRMVQVFVNLIRNAADALRSSRVHRDENSKGTIVLTADQRTRDDAPWVSVTVQDDGPGIDPSLLPRLFDPFVSSRLDSNGTGLGLAVSEGIVREHGGVLLARNRTDAPGAEFEVMLPIRAGEVPA